MDGGKRFRVRGRLGEDVEARTGLVIGGITAVAASVAVVTAVAFSNTAALADSRGTSIASEHVVVPSAASPSATPRATPTVTPEALTPSAQAEVVEAPAPVVVDPPAPASPPPPSVPATTPEVAQPAAPAPPTDLESAIAAAKASGTWDAIRNWASAHGWSTGRIDALLARLERERAQWQGDDTSWGTDSSGRQSLSSTQQKNQTGQRWTGADRPAHAGTNVGSGNGADDDAKKNQSRHSPDRRD